MFYGALANHSYELDAEVAALDAQDEARRAGLRVESVRHDIERLLLVCEALWEILKEEHGYDDEELMRRVNEIDARDGRMDGRLAATPPKTCPHCKRTLAKDRCRCIYCGKETPVDLFGR